ncbi:GAF and ANTAR domain-containing protein [Amycolatopsis sp. FDAARGOS 1241]|uniref:GAF and ANTAR domain-containing protein n=1 Tax=Amycolatopsis sp. FDAARGOS 1241 TaxID=2778070 RepID=UPI00194EF600|nr:GAF and ANTAR domain-containing protein [Amycolatopsis sp. FDAARGOS 1241]QRP50071.1 GAF and ANTAR domain-containing protein [Amycolatopsis sp. FDAARGOS 1241]
MKPELPLSDELAGVFARVSGLLLSAETATSVLLVLTGLARETFPDTAGAGLSVLGPGGDWFSTASTDEAVELADRCQYQTGTGPCLVACADRKVVRVDDLAREMRWPRWARRAQELGLRTSLSAPLVAGDEALGAVKVYGTRAGSYSSRDESLLAMFAAQAAVLVANTRCHADAQRVSERLRTAVRGRDVVNLAKGILMARGHVDEQTAFLQLAKTAQERGQPLHELADDLATTTVKRRR